MNSCVAQATLAKAPLVDVDAQPPNALISLLGNGMHVAAAGSIVLLTAIYARKK